MGAIGQSVYIIAYNVNRSGRAFPAGLLGVGPAVQVAELRTGGAGAGRRGWFRALTSALPGDSSPISFLRWIRCGSAGFGLAFFRLVICCSMGGYGILLERSAHGAIKAGACCLFLARARCCYAGLRGCYPDPRIIA